MIKVGLTGNIGTGKSTVAMIFETFGVPVYHADLEAKKMLENEIVKKTLAEIFGQDIFFQGYVDRKKLASVVFNDEKKLKILNSIIHPLVKKDHEAWIQQKQNFHYIIQEAAILFESGFYGDFDKVVLVVSSDELANKRVMDRDVLSLREVEQRRSNQWSQQRKMELSDFIIKNDEQDMLIPQVLNIHQKLMKSK